VLTATKFWLWLSLASDLKAAWLAYQHFGAPETAYFASEKQYQEIEGLNARQIADFSNKSMERVEQTLNDCHRLGVQIATWQDASYPERLRDISVPPVVLYFKGRPIQLDAECTIAVAGTRKCSNYGKNMAYRFARDLVRQGAVVVTGVAEGCDEAAVHGALDGGGTVVALLPGGVDVPFYNSVYYQQLYRDIAERGTLLSPYPPGTSNDHRHFQYRNPILTGLSVATLCVEASFRSGVMNVANCALEQGRSLYAVPANIDSRSAMGTNRLICDGLALPVMSASDILITSQASYQHLRVFHSSSFSPPQKTVPTPPAPPDKPVLTPQTSLASSPSAPEIPSFSEKKVDTGDNSAYIDLRNDDDTLTEDEKILLQILRSGASSSEELTAESGLSTSRTMTALTLLVLKGRAEELEGGRFQVK
jgi:DNA processing protein